MSKLFVISDTHGMHRELEYMPDGDVLVHCGDFSNVGERDQIRDFIDWFSLFPHQHKIFIAGNHDRTFDPKFWESPADDLWKEETLLYAKFKGLTYLENSEAIINGVKFWGSPITPSFYPEHWAFNADRGKKIKQYWEAIPSDTDVLITHGPPAHRLDWCMGGDLVGCEDLTYEIERVQPMFHLFGHIHESYGVEHDLHTTYVNASLLNHRYSMVNSPIELKLNNE
jgi:Icc-related predicted phosphoesterase